MLCSALFTAAFFVLAPGANAGLIPWLITGWERPCNHPRPSGPATSRCGSRSALLAAVACFVRFVTRVLGTPAPVAPTEQLVVGGLYRFVRNPMYVAVASMIAGQALLFRSSALAAWLIVFLIAVVAFVKVYEEPRLAEQFGESYERYRRVVPGWWPRLTPYRG